MTTDTPPFSADLLRGAAAIAEFMYGDPRLRRKVFYLAEKTKIPFFRIGAQVCARRSVLIKWISDQERKGLPLDPPKPKPSVDPRHSQDGPAPEDGAPPAP